MKSILSVLALVLIFLPVFAYAEPVYLDCTVLDFKNNSSIRFTVKVDEISEKITHTENGGKTYNIDGIFTPDKISYQTFMYRFDINTSTLEVKRFSDSKYGGSDTDTFLPAGGGECEILN